MFHRVCRDSAGPWWPSTPIAKFIVLPNTVLAAGGFVVFDETQFHAGPNAFALSADSGELYLFSGNGTDLTGYAHGFAFGAQARNVSFGRHVISTGEDHFVAQGSVTLDATNAGPRVGPVVLSEIMYRPIVNVVGNFGYDNTEDEFIELHNLTGSAVPLYDPTNPTHTWHLRGAVEFDFPENVVVPGGGYLLVVGFDPGPNGLPLGLWI